MKGKDIIAHAVRAEMPDREQLREYCIRQAESKTAVQYGLWLKRLVPVAACAVVILIMVLVLPSENNSIDSGTGNGSTNNGPLSSEIVGLPVEHHCLPQENQNAIRFGVSSLLDMFGPPGDIDFSAAHTVQAFAFVRVTETVQEDIRQISTVEVLRTVWSHERELPETMVLTQFTGSVACCASYGELMREGGVFLLPLWYNDGWYNWTYYDVLFEVDDNGLIWSRSNFSGFNRFDGRPTSVLTNAIMGIVNGDEDIGRDIAHTPFGLAADESVLAVVTAIFSQSTLVFPSSAWPPGNEIWTNRYTVSVSVILSTPTPFGLRRGGWYEQQQRWRDHWQVSRQWWQDWEQGIRITALSNTRHLLEPLQRYLVFITPSYSPWSEQFTFFSESAARINDDGTITPVRNVADNRNVFDEYDGYTVEQVSELAQLANTWHEKYVQ